MQLYIKSIAVGQVIEINRGVIHQSGKEVLRNVSFSMQNDEIVYLIGKTGSGKSSLLKVLYGELPLFDGTASIAGVDLAKLKRRHIPQLRRNLGIVFQDFQLLMDRSVLDNLRFVMGATGWESRKMMDIRAKEVLELVGLLDKINMMPHRMSGGEQQRIAIARALLNKPAIILADEPTGNLDPDTSEEIMKLLIAVAKEEKSAVFMATHNMTIVEKYPGRVLRVEEGMVKEVQSISNFNPFETFQLD